ncbi:RNA polymerase II transcription factor SIII subunit A-domain-containing protein [Bisporella sp. PMI_857]|nr:RNA polymerase II transcription factor SIII subunit A-domain-containing protein [Bisporella sp. PMI_857]
MGPSSLQILATKACVKNISSIGDVGELAYSQCRDVLKTIRSPAQLHLIEQNSPQIQGETEELWRAFIARDIPDWHKKNYVPRNPTGWYRVYEKYKRQQAREIAKSQEMLRQTLAGIKNQKATKVSKVLDLKQLPKLKKESRMVGRDGILTAQKSESGWGRTKDSSSLTWGLGSKTKTTTGKGVMDKARREAKEMSHIKRLSRPVNKFSQQLGKVQFAPPGLVDEYRRAARPTEQVGPVRILSKIRTNIVGKLPAAGPSLEDREARLRALTMRKTVPAPGQTVVCSSDEEESDEDDLFDEQPIPAPLPTTGSATSKFSTSASSKPYPSTTSRPGQAKTQFRPAPSSASQRPATTSSTLNKPRPTSQYSTSAAPAKPSDIISSMLSKPKSAPRPRGSSPTASLSAPATDVKRSGSPSPAPAIIMKKRAPVDVFNRKVKRPRVG